MSNFYSIDADNCSPDGLSRDNLAHCLDIDEQNLDKKISEIPELALKNVQQEPVAITSVLLDVLAKVKKVRLDGWLLRDFPIRHSSQPDEAHFVNCFFQGSENGVPLSLEGIRVASRLIFEECTYGSTLNLSGTELKAEVTFKKCRFGQESTSNDGHIFVAADLIANQSLIFLGCTFNGSIYAPRLRAKNSLRFLRCLSDGNHSNSIVTGDIDLNASSIGSNLSFRGVVCGGHVDLHGVQVAGALNIKPHGKDLGTETPFSTMKSLDGRHLFVRDALDIRHLEILEDLNLDHAKIGAIVGGVDIKPDPSTIMATHELVVEGIIRLANAQINGDVNLTGCKIGKGLLASHCIVNGNLKLQSRSLQITDIGQNADDALTGTKNWSVRLEGAIIRGYLGLAGAKLKGMLLADNVHVDGDVYMDSIEFGAPTGLLSFSVENPGSHSHATTFHHQVKKETDQLPLPTQLFVCLADATINGYLHFQPKPQEVSGYYDFSGLKVAAITSGQKNK